MLKRLIPNYNVSYCRWGLTSNSKVKHWIRFGERLPIRYHSSSWWLTAKNALLLTQIIMPNQPTVLVSVQTKLKFNHLSFDITINYSCYFQASFQIVAIYFVCNNTICMHAHRILFLLMQKKIAIKLWWIFIFDSFILKFHILNLCGIFIDYHHVIFRSPYLCDDYKLLGLTSQSDLSENK